MKIQVLNNWKITALLTLLTVISLYGQSEEININNPSFEDIPHRGGGAFDIGIKGWYDCGGISFKSETPPDIHPINAWQVTKQPADGRTYLGMVVRDNDTWESLSQRLRIPIEDGKCYSFNIELARSAYYVSGSKVSNQLENYTQPAVLRVWGGTSVCGKQELLGESVTVSNDEWRTYEFEFRPSRSVNYFTLEAFYKVPTLFPYNGHLLLDNASLITEIPCDEEEIPVSEAEEIAQEAPPRPRIPVKTAPAPVTESLEVADVENAPVTVEPEKSEPENIIRGLQGKNFRTGQVIRVNTIYFEADSTRFTEGSYDALSQIYNFMKTNTGIVIEVGGHTATAPPPRYCDWLSSERAKAVASFIAQKGISTKRLYYKGYGKRKPVIPNDKYNMEARQKNQRVEIKILMTDFSDAG